MIGFMSSGDEVMGSAVDASESMTLAAFIDRLRELVASRQRPLFIGIDGRSGAGKSTLATTISNALDTASDGDTRVSVIEGDGFYAGGSPESWDRRPAADRADRVIDWRRQRHVLLQLRELGVAEWFPFEWEAADWDGDTVPMARKPIVLDAGSVVVLEGAYSCRPELHDLLDLRVLLAIPRAVRRRQLVGREGLAYRTDWEARWSGAEDYYFGSVMPSERFDLRVHASKL
jgi:uridine kinase